MGKFKTICVLICVLLYNGLQAQIKNEKEYRVDFEVFPQPVKNVIGTLPKTIKRAKYYKEIDGDKHSLEMKFKFKKHWYSVEFDESGVLEDIEITIKKRQIPNEVYQAIHTYFTINSNKFDLIKIQEQYPYSSDISEVEFLNSIITNRKATDSNYEIIAAIKSGKLWELKEITFDRYGHPMSVRTLQEDSYEYIMY